MDGPQKKRDTRERVVSYQEQEATASLGSALDPMGNHGRTYNPGPDMIGDLGIVVLQLICDPRQDPSATMASQLLPLELIDKCVGSRIWVIMKGDKGACCIHLFE
ncbi:uncharacterized protein PFLUO_LOCUS2689 [Penicillium psychrofluorescens]|uniref:uncharacterized protein n=1 Tax=Penicillium psychrofluorescens TaxID=3158075 RepID=UPI003CCCFFAC